MTTSLATNQPSFDKSGAGQLSLPDTSVRSPESERTCHSPTCMARAPLVASPSLGWEENPAVVNGLAAHDHSHASVMRDLRGTASSCLRSRCCCQGCLAAIPAKRSAVWRTRGAFRRWVAFTSEHVLACPNPSGKMSYANRCQPAQDAQRPRIGSLRLPAVLTYHRRRNRHLRCLAGPKPTQTNGAARISCRREDIHPLQARELTEKCTSCADTRRSHRPLRSGRSAV